MKEALSNLINLVSNPIVPVISWVATIFFWRTLARFGNHMQGGGSPFELIELELTIKPENFTQILRTWTERAGFERSITGFRRHTQLDMLFAIAYPFALASLLAKCLRTAPLMGDRLVAIFVLAPFIAGLLDIFVENRSYLRILAGLSSPEDLAKIDVRHIRAAFIGAAIKWLLLAVSSLALLGALVNQLFFNLRENTLTLAVITIVLLALFAYFSSSLFRRAAQEYRGGQGKNVMALQLSFKKQRFVEIFRTWIQHSSSEDPVEAFRRHLLYLDFAFPVVYSLFAASLLHLCQNIKGEVIGFWLGIAFWLPFAAALFDWIENTIHYVILQGIEEESLNNVSGTAVAFASIFALLKFLFGLVWLIFFVWLFWVR